MLLVPAEVDFSGPAAATAMRKEGSSLGESHCQSLFQRGADWVGCPDVGSLESVYLGKKGKLSGCLRASIAADCLSVFPVQLVFVGAGVADREWGALLAARLDWNWISPTLWVQSRGGAWIVTQIDHSGNRSCQRTFDDQQPLVVSLRIGVADPIPPDPTRQGEFFCYQMPPNCHPATIISSSSIAGNAGSPSGHLIESHSMPLEPAMADIRHVNKLIAGGRGLGSRAGFDLLRQVASLLESGIAASRMAVDLGWIDHDRQVGQTGKTVEPDLYIACGISGASHHLDGIASVKQVVAINRDPQAPIMKRAQLGLVGDLYPVLEAFCQQLEQRLQQAQPSVQDSDSTLQRDL